MKNSVGSKWKIAQKKKRKFTCWGSNEREKCRLYFYLFHFLPRTLLNFSFATSKIRTSCLWGTSKWNVSFDQGTFRDLMRLKVERLVVATNLTGHELIPLQARMRKSIITHLTRVSANMKHVWRQIYREIHIFHLVKIKNSLLGKSLTLNVSLSFVHL